MALKFYIQVKGKVSGPLSGSELMSLAQLGKLLPTDMVRQDGSDKWVQANRIRNLDFGTPKEEPEEEIEEEILEVEPVRPNPAPVVNKPSTQQHFLINDDLPPAPNYSFVEFVAGVYTFLGVLTLIGSVIAVFAIGALESNGRDGKAGIIIGIIIFGAITSITCFAMAQLFAMAINGSRNLHYIMHSNLVVMRVMVRQFSKNE